jgi:hypothetical protein
VSTLFTPDEILSDLRSIASAGLTPDERTLWFASGSTYSDGEPVEILARISANADHIIISDGGMIHARASMFGADLDSAAMVRHLNAVRDDFSLESIADRFYIRCEMSNLAEYIAHLASACVALDSARLVIPPSSDSFVKALDGWLHEQNWLAFAKTNTVETRHGDPLRVTAVVESERGPVVLQAAGGRTAGSLKTSGEHAYFNLSALEDSKHPRANRLIVLEKTVRQKRAAKEKRRPDALVVLAVSPALLRLTKRLTEVANVAAFDAKHSILRFIEHGESDTRDLVSSAYGQTSV